MDTNSSSILSAQAEIADKEATILQLQADNKNMHDSLIESKRCAEHATKAILGKSIPEANGAILLAIYHLDEALLTNQSTTLAEHDEAVRASESAWVIERPINGGSLYYAGVCGLKTHDDAIRFAREIDANKVLNVLKEMKLISGNYIVTQHVWCG